MRVDQIFPSKFLKAAEIGNQSFTLTIANVTLEDVGDDGGQQKPVLHFSGAPKGMPLNRTNGATLEWLYGPETDAWIGKQVVLFAEMTQYKGTPMLGMRLRGPNAPAAMGGVPGAPVTAPAPGAAATGLPGGNAMPNPAGAARMTAPLGVPSENPAAGLPDAGETPDDPFDGLPPGF